MMIKRTLRPHLKKRGGRWLVYRHRGWALVVTSGATLQEAYKRYINYESGRI